MQSLGWYLRRAVRMRPDELLRQARDSARNVLDVALLPARQKPLPLAALLPSMNGQPWRPPFRVTALPVGGWADAADGSIERDRLDRLTRRAESIVAGRLSFFSYEDQPLGSPVDWNRDHPAGQPAPLGFAPWIDYRDVRQAGDCKRVWEPSRHHQFVVLARAYRASGGMEFARAFAEQLEGWLDQCPFGCGMQWRSPLELGIRLINWVWAVDLTLESGAIGRGLFARLVNAVYRHAWQIDRNYSGGSAANNHLIGEAAGAYIACCYFADMRDAERFRRRARRILNHAIFRQTFEDGVSRELSSGYHLFVLQFFLLAGLAGRWAGDDFPREYWTRVERMAGFTAALAEGGPPPMLGDCDDGYVLDLCDCGRNADDWLAVAGAASGSDELVNTAMQTSESVHWLAPCQPDRLHFHNGSEQPTIAKTHARAISSRAFPDAGYYLLQFGQGDSRISVLFDCGPLGLPPLFGHGHADALSFTLRAFGRDVLVDPGTYDYFTDRPWRDYFRSTAAHNCLRVDGRDQSSPAGLFMWARPVRAYCRDWQPTPIGGSVEGEHDGYARLADPVVHRRRIELSGSAGRVFIRDELITRGGHDIELSFQLAEECTLTALEGTQYRIDAGAGAVTLTLDERLTPRVLIGSDDPPGGWVSRSLHRKVPAPMIRAVCRIAGPTVLNTLITLNP